MSINAFRVRPRIATAVLLGGGALGGWAYRAKSDRQTSNASYLDPDRFSKFALGSRKPVSSSSSIFSLYPASTKPGQTSESIEPARAIWSIQLKQPQLQIARSYTPLPTYSSNLDTQRYGDAQSDAVDKGLQLLIRREAGGEVSGYLHKLPLESLIEVRGPHIEYEIPTLVNRILFLAGGTGIAPALQAAAALAKSPEARIHIIWANRRREDCVGLTSPKSGSFKSSGWSLFNRSAGSESAEPAHSETEALENPIVKSLLGLQRSTNGRVTFDCFVDEEQQFVTPRLVHQAMEDLKGEASDGDGQVLLSGPDGFIGYWAGKKEWQNGREGQGKLGGVLAGLPLGGWTVWKL